MLLRKTNGNRCINQCDTIKGNESHVGHFQFSFITVILLCVSNATFWTKPRHFWLPGSRVTSILDILKTLENKRIYYLYCPVTQNQYSRHPTHSPLITLIRSHGGWLLEHLMFISTQYINMSLLLKWKYFTREEPADAPSKGWFSKLN